MKRIGLLVLVLLILAVSLVADRWATPARAQSRELVVAAWGDPYEAGWRKALVPRFEKENNAKVVWVQGFSSQTLAKLRAQKDNPQIDVAMLDDGPHRQAAALGLVEKIDRSKLPNAKQLYDVAFEPGDLGLGFAIAAYGLYYNAAAFQEKGWAPPTSWLDLYRPEFKGRVSVHNIANANGLYLLLALNKIAGGTDDNADRGFAKVKELVPNVVTFDKFGETPTLIQQGQAVVGTWNLDRVVNLASTGVPVKFVQPKEGTWGHKEVVTIVKGRPNADLAYKWIDLLLAADEQANTAKYVGLSPLNRNAQLDPQTAATVLYGPGQIEKLVIPSWEVVNAKRSEWTERWNKEVERR
jgi:putative spermidine/putrescine transport system substrate-binding protein